MPDGTVLSPAAGTPTAWATRRSTTRRSTRPSYLFNGPRPTITSAPPTSTYGSTITVTTPDAATISAVNLVSLGTDTHQMRHGPAFRAAELHSNSGSSASPCRQPRRYAPPGHYMLFILNNSGRALDRAHDRPQPVHDPRRAGGARRTSPRRRAMARRRCPGRPPATATAPSPATPSPLRSAGPRRRPPWSTASPPATSATVTGLTNGTSYTFTVTATNAVGTGPASSPSNAVTPTAPTAPAAPTGVTATAGNAAAAVSWTAPSDGGSPITSYTITPYLSGTAQPTTTVNGSPPATTTTVTSLANGSTYTFKVTGTNAVGTGPASAASNSVTPSAATTPAFVQQASKHGAGRDEHLRYPFRRSWAAATASWSRSASGALPTRRPAP